ncbi:unnamed protein product [Ectocarpus sp. CCAP 1310/34]|nr:unnamed protein product [Ectocarpus sp. CCAP 1310/34]
MAGSRLCCTLASNASALASCTVVASAVQSSLTSLSCSNSEDGGSRRRGNNRRVRERSEEEAEPVNPCAEFNTLKWRMSYAHRKNDCNGEDSCVFVGRSVTGACVPRDPSILHKRRSFPNVPLVLPDSDGSTKKLQAALQRQHTAKVMSETIDELESEFEHKGVEPYSDTKLAANKFRELMSALDVEESTQELALAILQEEGMHAVQVFVKSQLANAAAEELRYQKSATEAFAKDFLMEVIREPELPGQMGHMLESVFKDPALSTGIRHLIYNAVGLDYTYQSSLTLTIPLIRWLLSETDWMDAEAAKLCAYLVRLEQTELATILLVAWAIREPGILDPSSSRGLAASLPLGSQQITDSMVWALTETLKSDWALEMAKSTTVEMIKSRPNGTDKE